MFRVKAILIGVVIAMLPLFLGCDKVLEEVKSIQIKTITYDDFRYQLDSKNRRGYLFSNGKLMSGHFMVVKDSLPAEEFEVSKGYLNGVHRTYNDKGQKIKEYYYKHHTLDGLQRTYYDTGEVRTEVTYFNGRRDSDKLGFDPSGNIIYKLTTEKAVTYQYYYKDKKTTRSEFEKNISGAVYDMVVIYNHFEVVEFIVGHKKETDGSIFSVFDGEFNVIETIDARKDWQKAIYYISALETSDIFEL